MGNLVATPLHAYRRAVRALTSLLSVPRHMGGRLLLARRCGAAERGGAAAAGAGRGVGWDGTQPPVLARGAGAARCLASFCSRLHIF